MPDVVRTDRRRFLKHATLAAAALASGPATAFAQSKAKARSVAKPAPKSAPATPPAAGATPPVSEDAKALAEVIRRRYGQHLTNDQLEAVTRQIDGSIQGGRRLKDVKFANGDEPDFTFVP